MKHKIIVWTFALVSTILVGHTLDSDAAQINFRPSVTGSEEYNDNIFLDSTNEESDYITSAGVGLEGEVLWRNAGLQLNYTPSHFWYKDNSDLDYWRHSASGNVWREFTRNTRFEMRNTYLRTANPSDESEQINQDAPLEGRDIDRDLNRRGVEKYYTNVTSARLSHQFGERDNVYLGYSYSVLRNINASTDNDREEHDISGPTAGIAYWFTHQWGTQLDGSFSNRNLDPSDDRDEYDGTARLLYRFTRHLDGFVSYRHTYVDFKNETSDTDYTIYKPEFGIFYPFPENSHARIGLGYYIQDKDSTDNPDVDDNDNTGFVVDSEVYKAWPFRRGNIALIGTSGYQIDDGGSEDNGFNIYYQARVDADYALMRRLTADIFLGYRIDDYPDDEPSRTDYTLNTGAGLSYQPLTWLTSRLEYSYRDKDSDRNEDQYTENRIFFSITLSPDQPFRLFR
ncbi:MAG: outer membrane beta-barrel protein [Desulfosarcina sp.]|nr:outer membrane beta-barrel protein [Desulfobacterales bacterium]